MIIDDHARVTAMKFVPTVDRVTGLTVTGQFDAVATFDDKSSSNCTCFSYFNDEHSFTAKEFIGMTRDQVRRHFIRQDIAYLKSKGFI